MRKTPIRRRCDMQNTSTIPAVMQGQQTRTRPRAKKIGLILAIALPILLLLAYFGISAYVFDQLSHPHRSPVTSTPAQYGLTYQDVTFSSTDGIRLSGWYIDSPGSKV